MKTVHVCGPCSLVLRLLSSFLLFRRESQSSPPFTFSLATFFHLGHHCGLHFLSWTSCLQVIRLTPPTLIGATTFSWCTLRTWIQWNVGRKRAKQTQELRNTNCPTDFHGEPWSQLENAHIVFHYCLTVRFPYSMSMKFTSTYLILGFSKSSRHLFSLSLSLSLPARRQNRLAAPPPPVAPDSKVSTVFVSWIC